MPLLVGLLDPTVGFSPDEVTLLSSVAMGLLAADCGLGGVQLDPAVEPGGVDDSGSRLHPTIACYRFRALVDRDGDAFWRDCLHTHTGVDPGACWRLVCSLQQERYLRRMGAGGWMSNNGGYSARAFAVRCEQKAHERLACDVGCVVRLLPRYRLLVARLAWGTPWHDLAPVIAACLPAALFSNRERLAVYVRRTVRVPTAGETLRGEGELREALRHEVEHPPKRPRWV